MAEQTAFFQGEIVFAGYGLQLVLQKLSEAVQVHGETFRLQRLIVKTVSFASQFFRAGKGQREYGAVLCHRQQETVKLGTDVVIVFLIVDIFIKFLIVFKHIDFHPQGTA